MIAKGASLTANKLEGPMRKVSSIIGGFIVAILASTTSYGADVAPLLNELSAIESIVQANASAFNERDVAEIRSILSQAKDRASAPSNGNGADCAYRAQSYHSFSQAQATRLCAGGGTVATADCAYRARSYHSFTADQAVAICAARGTDETADCAYRARSYHSFTAEQAVRICAARGTQETADCAYRARSYHSFSAENAVEICAGRGTAAAADCAYRARSYHSFSDTLAVRICSNGGTDDNADCAYRARSNGNSPEQAAELCRNSP